LNLLSIILINQVKKKRKNDENDEEEHDNPVVSDMRAIFDSLSRPGIRPDLSV
jgi:hypothetical protein